jgi:hypothetical protein
MTEKSDTQRHSRGGIVGPTLLIAAGIFFLLSNLGIISWSFWDAAWRLWPIVLIAIGLDLLIGRRSIWSSLLVLLVTVGFLAAGFFWLVTSGDLGGGSVSDTISQSLSGAESAEVEINFGVGRVTVEALPADSEELIMGSIERPAEIRVEQSFDVTGDDVAHYRLRTEGSARSVQSIPFFGPGDDNWRWDMQLNRDVPLRLTLDTGVGETTLDLSQLMVETVDVDTGVGQTTVILPGHGEIEASVNGGVGELIIELPQGVAARIESDTGLGSTDIADDFERNGDVYESPGYDDALDRINLSLSAGIGQVTVRTYGGR